MNEEATFARHWLL